jgi:uncharacterized protein YggE
MTKMSSSVDEMIRRTSMLIAWLLALLLGFPVVTLAHDETKPETPTLTVSETGMVTHAPDTAFVTFGLETAGAEAEQRRHEQSHGPATRSADRQGTNPNLVLYGLPAISTAV